MFPSFFPRTRRNSKCKTANNFKTRFVHSLEVLEDRTVPTVFFVTSTDDTVANDGVVTLREAILAANTNAASGDAPAGDVGLDVIKFNIAGNGVHTISPLSSLQPITEALTIDGFSQPGSSANTLAVGDNAQMRIEINGANAGLGACGITITADDCTIKGLVINGFDQNGIEITSGKQNLLEGNFLGTDVTGEIAIPNGNAGVRATLNTSNLRVGGSDPAARNILSGNAIEGLTLNGNGHVVQGNYIGTNAGGNKSLRNAFYGFLFSAGKDLLVGGAAPGEGNVISGQSGIGLYLFNSTDSATVQGNFIGTDATGTAALSNSTGIFVQHTTNSLIGGLTSSARNIISGNTSNGVRLQASDTFGNTIEGNYIGLDVLGTSKIANYEGVAIESSSHDNQIGSAAPGGRNYISGNSGPGIDLSAAVNNTIVNNAIGIDVNSAILGNQFHGIMLRDASTGNVIGTTAAGNIIAGNSFNGVLVQDGSGNSIIGNSIYGNSKLGIDLGSAGVAINDNLDLDTGANNLQNYPVLTNVVSNGAATTVAGTFSGAANSTFTLHFYSDIAKDATGFGEGRTYLGQTTVNTDGAGVGSFVASLATGTTAQFVTATATDAANNTSEFAASVAVAAPSFIVTSVPVLSTNESGATATFTVQLSAIPAANVQIMLSSSNPNEASVFPTTLVFTPANALTPQTVTVTGVDDSIFDGSVDYAIQFTPSTSADPVFAGLDPADVAGTNANNDAAPTVTLQRSGAAFLENSGSMTVTATLSGLSAFPTIVNLGFTGSATNGTDYTTSANFITIPAGSLSASITLTGMTDADMEPVETIIVDVTTITGGPTEQGTQRVTGAIVDPGVGLLFTLTPNADTFSLNTNVDITKFGVLWNGDDLGLFTPGQSAITVQGLDGNDTIAAANGLSFPMFVDGGNGDDLIVGGNANDILIGGAGDDHSFGLGGNDSVLGGAGNDGLDGGDGNDTISGESGFDYIVGGNGADSLLGGTEDDGFDAGAGNDFIDGAAGNDFMYGMAGNDTLLGQDGNDGMDAGAGDDSMDGGIGDDFMYGLDGKDTMVGGDGADGMDGGLDNDSMLGGLGNDLLFGNFGNDAEFGQAGSDSIDGNSGNDTLDGGADADLIFSSGGGIDLILGGAGNDTLQNIDSNATILAGDGNDSIFGANFLNDSILGEAGNDTIFALSGNDTILTGDGADVVDGGEGQDLVPDFVVGDVLFNVP